MSKGLRGMSTKKMDDCWQLLVSVALLLAILGVMILDNRLDQHSADSAKKIDSLTQQVEQLSEQVEELEEMGTTQQK